MPNDNINTVDNDLQIAIEVEKVAEDAAVEAEKVTNDARKSRTEEIFKARRLNSDNAKQAASKSADATLASANGVAGIPLKVIRVVGDVYEKAGGTVASLKEKSC